MGILSLGFADAPVSRIIVLGTLLLSIFAPDTAREKIHLDVRRALGSGEVWRLVTCHTIYAGLPEMILGSLCLFTFRIIERQTGSKKFAALVVVSLALATPIEAACAEYFESLRPVSGPLPLVFALFVLYYVSIPTVHPSLLQCLGMNLSEKSLTYILGFELMVLDGWNSFLPALSGAAMGVLYVSDAMSLQDVRLPRLAYQCCLIWQRRPATLSRPGRGIPAVFGRLRLGPQSPVLPLRAPPPAPPLPPSEIEIGSLTGMGFERRQVLQALAQTGNSVERAANRLLAGSQPTSALSGMEAGNNGHLHPH